MFVTKSKTKTSITYYLSESFWNPSTKKSSTRTVERIGTHEELIKKFDSEEQLSEWLKTYAKNKTEEEKNKNNVLGTNDIPRKFDDYADEYGIKNAGYLLLQKVCYELDLPKLFGKIEKKENLNFNLFNVVSCLIYNRLLDTYSKTGTVSFSKTLIEDFQIDTNQINTTFNILFKYCNKIQIKINKNLNKLLDIDQDYLFYNCSNYSIERSKIQKIDNRNLYNSNSTIYLAKIFYNSLAIPIAFSLDVSNKKANKINKKIENYLKQIYKNSTLYICPEYISSSSDSNTFTSFENYKRITLEDINKFSKELQDWAYDPDGWCVLGEDKKFNIKQIEDMLNNKDMTDIEYNKWVSQIYYKVIYIRKSKNKSKSTNNEALIVLFDFENKYWYSEVRNNQILYFKQLIENKLGKKESKNFTNYINKYKKLLVKEESQTNQLSVYDTFYYFDDKNLRKGQEFDGFFAFFTDSDDKIIETTIDVLYSKMAHLEDLLYYIKKENVDCSGLSTSENFYVHYLISVMCTIILKLFMFKLNSKFSTQAILASLNNLSFCKIPKLGWIPTYNPNIIINKINEKFGLMPHFGVISDKEIASIIKRSKNSKMD